MATTYYCDPAGSDTAPYDTWAKAAQDPNTIEAIHVAGDIAYARGTFVGQWQWAASGTATTVPITWIGCAADGTPYGGQFIVNRNSAGNFAIDMNNHDYRDTHNVTAQNADLHGWYMPGQSAYCLFEQCIGENNGADGWFISGRELGNFYLNCIARNNTSDGFFGIYLSRMFGCYSYNNTNEGFNIYGGAHIVHCGAYDNDADNIVVSATNTGIFNCFSHGSSAGSGVRFAAATYYTKIAGCAFTNNNQYGIEIPAGACQVHEDYNGFLDNGVADRLNCPTGRHSGTFTASPYVNAAGGDFTTAATADFRRTLIPLSITDETINRLYIAYGLIGPDAAAAGGGGLPMRIIPVG